MQLLNPRFFACAVSHLLILAIAACSSPTPREFVAPTPEFQSFSGRPVAVAAPTLASDVLSLRDSRSRFSANVFCGVIQFSGGYVRGPAEQGAIIQNRLMTLSLESEFRKEAATKSAGLIAAAFRERNIAATMLSTGIPPHSLTLTGEVDFRARPDEGRDSINLPLSRYQGGPTLSAAARATLSRSAGHDGYIVVPVVLRYFRHNAGWFNGQEIGAYAGARIALKLLIYDLRSGAKVFDEDYEQKRFAVGQSIVNPNEYFRMQEEIRNDILEMLSASLPRP